VARQLDAFLSSSFTQEFLVGNVSRIGMSSFLTVMSDLRLLGSHFMATPSHAT
jgi:hypothetical protein